MFIELKDMYGDGKTIVQTDNITTAFLKAKDGYGNKINGIVLYFIGSEKGHEFISNQELDSILANKT